MSIDNFVWVPAGIRNDKNIGFRKYKSWAEMNTAEAAKDTPHQAFLAHGKVLIDEQYFFEDPEDARWFWTAGYKRRLLLNDSLSLYHMALWIDDKQVATRYEENENPTCELGSRAPNVGASQTNTTTIPTDERTSPTFLESIKWLDAEVGKRFEERSGNVRGMYATQEEVDALRLLAATLAMVFGPFPGVVF
jgi:hypothetical protein